MGDLPIPSPTERLRVISGRRTAARTSDKHEMLARGVEIALETAPAFPA
jgi:hypothetical protein